MLMSRVLRFLRCGRGNVIVTFALTLPLLIGAGGAAVDYGKAVRIRSIQASIADATALLGANADSPAAAIEARRLAEAQVTARLATQIVPGSYTISNDWITTSRYRVTISTRMKTSLVYVLRGMPTDITISVATTVQRVDPAYQTAAPSLTQLSPNADDYNQIYFYCYSSDPNRQSDPDHGRRNFKPIADNAGGVFSLSATTSCEGKETPSYMLLNVTNGLKTPSKRTEVGAESYAYFTDTTIDGARVETMNMKGYNAVTGASVNLVSHPILETVICTSVAQCKSQSQGGILPNAGTHSPATATGSCEEGKFMYFGWEDRPNGDRDYDDIRLVISCPQLVRTSDKQLRIVE